MEEKVKLSNLKNVDSAGSLHRKYQDLLKAMQGKDELIGQLEAQLEKQVRLTHRGTPLPLAASALAAHSSLRSAPQLAPSGGCSFT